MGQDRPSCALCIDLNIDHGSALFGALMAVSAGSQQSEDNCLLIMYPPDPQGMRVVVMLMLCCVCVASVFHTCNLCVLIQREMWCMWRVVGSLFEDKCLSLGLNLEC